MTNILLAVSAFACLRFRKYRVMGFKKWPQFFVLMGLSSLVAGVGHHYNDQNEWLLFSRFLMLISLFYAVWASRLLYNVTSFWFSPLINTTFFISLIFILIFTNAFWPVIVGVIASFGICVPSGLHLQNQWKTRSGREMLWGISLLVIGGIWFGLNPLGDQSLDRHLAHLPVSTGTVLIGLSLSNFRKADTLESQE